jgi:DNA polymerase-3 subunit epsilon/oligoribonuclease
MRVFMLGIFLDTETNGLDPQKHRVLEIAFKIIDLSTGEEKKTFNTLVKISHQMWALSDPVSLEVCGITFEEITQGLPIETIQNQLKTIFLDFDLKRGKSVFICQNPSFDRVFFSQLLDVTLQEKMNIPYHWLDLASMFWGFCMERAKAANSPYPWEIGFTKDKIATFFHLDKEEKPHRAINGVNHLIACYSALLGFPGKPTTCKI